MGKHIECEDKKVKETHKVALQDLEGLNKNHSSAYMLKTY